MIWYYCGVSKLDYITAVQLHDAPSEVTDMVSNPALEFEKLFNILKFQIAHYKKALSASNDMIMRLKGDKRALLRCV